MITPQWIVFWILKPTFALGVWYGMDDRLAAHFNVPSLGNVPLILAFGVLFFISLASEQFSVMRVRERQS